MSDEPGTINAILIPDSVNAPADVIFVLDQIIGQNVRHKAHIFWHQTQVNERLSPGEITIRYAQVQMLLDYADEVDPQNSPTTEWLLEHFGWKIPSYENEDTDALDDAAAGPGASTTRATRHGRDSSRLAEADAGSSSDPAHLGGRCSDPVAPAGRKPRPRRGSDLRAG